MESRECLDKVNFMIIMIQYFIMKKRHLSMHPPITYLVLWLQTRGIIRTIFVSWQYKKQDTHYKHIDSVPIFKKEPTKMIDTRMCRKQKNLLLCIVITGWILSHGFQPFGNFTKLNVHHRDPKTRVPPSWNLWVVLPKAIPKAAILT
jgi:hypothetical protein